MPRLLPLLSRIAFLPRKSLSACVLIFGLASVVLSLTGCSHYHLGTGAKLKFHTIFISPVASDIILPQARTLATARIREAFLRDPRVTVVDSPDVADAIVSVSLKSFGRESAVAKPDDTGLTRKFTLQLSAACSLRTKDGQTLLQEKRLRIQRDAYTDSGQLLAERDSLPLLLDSLAKDITHLVLDTW